MKKNIVCGIGNALVDSEYKVSDEELERLKLSKGCMELNDSKNHIKLSKSLCEEHGVVKMMPGGSVANSLYTLTQFGLNVSFIGKVSSDTTGNYFIDSLKNIGMGLNINQVDNGISGECLVLITPDHERTMYTHLGVSSDLCLDDIDINVIKSFEYLLIEGYLVTSTETKKVASYSLDVATDNKVKKIITLSDPNVINFFKNDMLDLISKRFDIIFCNKQEALNISDAKNIDDAIDFLKQYSEEIIITCGSDGAYAYYDGDTFHECSEAVSPVDLTGAGDMFLAAYLYAKFNKKNISECLVFANRCAGVIIQKYGAKLDNDNSYKELHSKL